VTGRTWALVIIAGIVAGVGSWLATEAILKGYEATFVKGPNAFPTPEEDAQHRKISIVGGTVALGATGGLLGLVLGLAGGVSRPSIRAALSAGLLGLLVGAVGEGGVARMVLWFSYTKMDLASDDLLPPMLCHLVTWSFAGALGGLAFGIGIGGRLRWLRTMLGGAFAAAIAIIAYDIIGAVLFSTHGTHQPHANYPETRALAQGLVSIATAIGSVVAARDPKRKPVVPADTGKPSTEV
jgi:hypothetical protein